MTRRRRKLLMTMAGTAAFGLGLLSSLNSAPAQERFDMRIREDFFAGFGGDEEALKRGMKACEAAIAANPDAAEALVWHGGGLYFLGGRAFQTGDSKKAMEMVQRGMAEMSRAVELQPDQVGVRIPRGAILLQSSLFMPESDFTKSVLRLGLEDYLHALKLQEAHFDKLGTHQRGELLSGIASAYSRSGNADEAARYYRRIATELKGSAYAKRAEKWLATKSLTPQESTCLGCHVAGSSN